MHISCAQRFEFPLEDLSGLPESSQLESETLHEIPFGLTETFLNSLSVEFSRKNRFPLPSSRTALLPAVCNVLSFVAASQLYPVHLACWYPFCPERLSIAARQEQYR